MTKRHNLVYISYDARKDALERLSNSNENVKNLVLNENIPAIISRQSMCKDGFLQCGLTSSSLYDDNRLRIAIEVPKNSIIKTYTPFDVFDNRVCNTKVNIANDIIKLGEVYGFDIGFYGSYAMELITGINYINQKSDIDIYIKKNNDKFSLLDFYENICLLEKKHNIKIDGELEILNEFGIKIKEFFNSQKTILAKGINSVEIFSKECVGKSI